MAAAVHVSKEDSQTKGTASTEEDYETLSRAQTARMLLLSGSQLAAQVFLCTDS
jgi:hypothetical protein